MADVFPDEKILKRLIALSRHHGICGRHARAELCRLLYPHIAALAGAALRRVGAFLPYPQKEDLVQTGVATVFLRLARCWKPRNGSGHFGRYVSRSLRLDFEKIVRRESRRISALVPIASPDEGDGGDDCARSGWLGCNGVRFIDPERDIRISCPDLGYEAVEVAQLLRVAAEAEPLGAWAVATQIQQGSCSLRALVRLARKASNDNGHFPGGLSRMSLQRARKRAIEVLKALIPECSPTNAAASQIPHHIILPKCRRKRR